MPPPLLLSLTRAVTKRACRPQRIRGVARLGNGPAGSGGGVVVNPLLANLVSQYKMNEASGAFVDSIGGFNLTAVNSPGVGSHLPLASRSYNGTNYGSAAMNAAQDCSGKDFSLDCLFWPIFNSQTYDVFASRNAGAGDGNIEFLLRATSAQNIEILIGDGVGGFTVRQLVGGYTSASKFHLALSFVNATKAVRYSVNGGVVQSYTNGSAPTTAPGSCKISLGGDVAELMASGSEISASRLWVNRVLADADFTSLWNGGNGLLL